ncbi:hypothetical protein NPIL_573111 [Nephila pilipes]|uniref:Uncharacterized protein n=1 Tax=Nephila pilipes TaxID=299642 RepID=A0A8X6P7C7_NEPPI|nr:hypothetical protein NPIL_573111 [Nephila pilipes]
MEQPKFERDETLRERRASQARKVLQTYLQQEIESRRSFGGRSPPRTTIIEAPKSLTSLPQREMESRRCFRRPQPSENDYHRSTETFWEVYPKARLEAAEV